MFFCRPQSILLVHQITFQLNFSGQILPMASGQEAHSSNSSNSNSAQNCRFKVFRDEEELERGEIISEKLLKIIEQSRFAIVIVSENYASSSWCLDELQHIIFTSRSNELHLRVFPIFHHVDPSQVRKLEGSFGEGFDSLKERFDNDKVEKWRDSLKQLAALAGWVSKEWYESRLVDDVVEKLSDKIYGKFPHTSSDKLIGIDRRIHEIEELHLKNYKNLDDVKFVGIWGMGGVGKTALAGAIYEKLHDEFDFHCFLANVREDSERCGLFSLQKRLHSLLRGKNNETEDTFVVRNIIQEHFRERKVMLILDDVTSSEQITELARREWFGAGSRVIITTRDFHLLRSHDVGSIYEVQPMNEDESLRLFCQKAFRRDYPEEAFLEKSKLAINYAEGLPLALLALGSFFCGKSVDEWESALDMLKEDSNNQIFQKLKISFDALCPAEKAIFLDIACFFNKWGINEVRQILNNCGLHAPIGRLVEKSLVAEVEIGNAKYIKMHSLIQDMGRSIVWEESPKKVEERSRLWCAKEIDEVLAKNKGTNVTEGVVLPFFDEDETERKEGVALPSSFDRIQKRWIRTAFSKMGSLRLLVISCNVHLLSGLKDLPRELKVLDWYEYPLESLPSGAKLDELIYLKLQNTKIKRLGHGCSMDNLKFLDLSHSKHLTGTPDFSKFQKLHRLVLEGCQKLVRIHPSLGQLHSLVEINFRDCKNLKYLPRELKIASLEVFVLCGCTKVKKLPNFGECMGNLKVLDVKETGIAKLPESLVSLINLETLDLRGCQNLVGLPHDIHKLRRLKVLDIFGCSKFSELPKNLEKNEALEKLDASRTAIIEGPPSIGYRTSFHQWRRPKSKSLITPRPTFIFRIKSLRELDLSGCNIPDGFILEDLGHLSLLRKLDLSGNKFENLPYGCMSSLSNLQFLYLNSCSMLLSLPRPPPSLDLVDAGGCTSLSTLSDESLLHLLDSVNQNGQYAESISHSLDADSRASLSIKTFSVTIPGSEIPSWFQSQKSLRLNEEGERSIIVDVPSSDWLGFALCIVLENDMFYSTEAFQNAFCWRYYFAKASDDQFVFLQERDRKLEKPINSPHLWILFVKVGKQTCSSLSTDYSRLHLKFDAEIERKDELKVWCGWRVMSETDFERLRLAMELHVDHQENASCSEAQEGGQPSLSPSDQNLNDSRAQFITNDASLLNGTPPDTIESPSPSNSLQRGPSERATTSQEATNPTDDSIEGKQFHISVPKQNLSCEIINSAEEDEASPPGPPAKRSFIRRYMMKFPKCLT
ncbi:TMV resistance protein N-like isoform X2 [Prosopis cineraria]|uniref:TMV resistance protein N-like isoform X2 n=1 Tax=Prosopis cineraria TaxID=364024 RepID=UPI00240EDA34|nr:TMV resistance protein N-like isoform X2 [Prosopis cineraria]